MAMPLAVIKSVRQTALKSIRYLLNLSHQLLAWIGLSAVFAGLALFVRPDIRDEGEQQLMSWLNQRHIEAIGMVPQPDAIDRATASDPSRLPQAQAKVAYWLSKKYRVAAEPLSALVAEAYEAGARASIDPTLILAIMAIESSFNPFAQSQVGAQGLMQVMTEIHADKYERFGGQWAAFDPVTNLRVGIKVLQDCIARAGSLEGGLRYYVGAANLPNDGGYTAKVLDEYSRLKMVAKGAVVPLYTVPAPTLVAQQPAPAVVPAIPVAESPVAVDMMRQTSRHAVGVPAPLAVLFFTDTAQLVQKINQKTPDDKMVSMAIFPSVHQPDLSTEKMAVVASRSTSSPMVDVK